MFFFFFSFFSVDCMAEIQVLPVIWDAVYSLLGV